MSLNFATPISLVESIFDDEETDRAATLAVSVVAETTIMTQFVPGDTVPAGRVLGSRNVRRGKCSWFADYLSHDPVYPSSHFRQVFRIPLSLYWKIYPELIEEEPLLETQFNELERQGYTAHQKILSALRRLGSGMSFKQLADNARMSPEWLRTAFRLTKQALFRRYGPIYLNREPTLSELREVVRSHTNKGFPGCIGSLDCMHLH